jgi:hypothetical protein
MTTNNGRFCPHLGDSRADTSHAVALRHAASVRPCAPNPHGKERSVKTPERSARAPEENAEIVVGPDGPRIAFRKPQPSRWEE